MTNLYQHEEEALEVIQKKLDDDNCTMNDVREFKDVYQNLFEESRMMIKISDRLQKKLDTAKKKVQEKNEEVLEKNQSLKEAIEKLAKARVGKKASTIMFTMAIFLFVSEELYIEPFVEYFADYSYLIWILKGGIALSLKFFESFLESYFVGGEKKKILIESREAVVA